MGNATRPVRKELSSLIAQILCFALLCQACGVAEALERRTVQRAAASARSGSGTGGTDAVGVDSASSWKELARLGGRLAAAARETLEAVGDRGVRLASVSAQATQETGRRLLESLVDRDRSDDSDDEAAEPSASRAALESPGLPPAPPSGSTLAAALSGAQAAAGPAMPVDLSQVALAIGPNLISLPNQPPDTDPAAVLAPIAGQFTAAFAYDACDPVDPWKLYDPADPGSSDLTAIDHKLGVWIDATAATSLPSDGSQPPVTQIQLCTGWNLIGYPLGQERPVLAALASMAGKFTRVFGFDPADPADLWEVFDVAAPGWANDLGRMTPGRGYWVLATQDTQLDFENDGAAPEVEILIPAVAAEVASIEDVVGSVRSGLLDTWTLSYRASGASNAADPFVTFATGDTPVESAPLGSFDPTLLLNGMYDLKLEALDFQGRLVETTVPVVVDGQRKIGVFTLSFSDLQVPLSGIDIEIVRTYDSRDKKRRDFGVGWALDIKQATYENNRPPGDGWQIVDSPPPTSFPCVGGVETKPHLTTIRLSDLEVYRFRLELFDTGPVAAGCIAKARFAYVDGPTPGAELQILGNTNVQWGTGTDFLFDPIAVALYEPTDVRLVTRDGREFDLVLGQGVATARDSNGNELAITPTSIAHSSGVTIAIERDFSGRIVRITDPEGDSTEYAYDGAGDLVASTDRAGNTTTFAYDGNHGLVDIFDPLGNRAVRTGYDGNGRLISTTDANGQTISFDRDVDARREVITNRLGAVRVVEYDARGNITREVDELGNETLRTFDGEDNLLTETDPLGRTTTYTYTAENDLASIADPIGNTTLFTYDAAGRVLTTLDPRGKVTTDAYDASGNLTSTTDAAGNVTSFTYDSAGNQLTGTDALDNVTTFEYDPAGNVTREVDALGNETTYTHSASGERLSESRTRTLPGGGTETLVTTFAYDALGRLITTTAADGSTNGLAYDALGRVIRRTDEIGRVTQLTYDDRGRHTGTTLPDATSESRTYDDEGRLLTETDRAGRSTSFTYDAAGRRLTTTAPDGGITTDVYDAAGQLASTTDARGYTTTYSYDAAGRRTTVTDPLGRSFVTAHDAAGNQSAITDARGNTTSFTYDDLNRRTVTTLPDGNTTERAYDALGRTVSETDQAGKLTQFGYDALGRLTSVIDALGQVTSFTYDEVGNRLTQTDANGNTTSFTYDALGRQISRTFPGGATESSTYNSDGTQASRTDFNGITTTFEHDVNRRLTRRLYPDASEVTFAYTPTGRRARYTDARGVTTFTYDALDRMTSMTMADGRSLTYTYDLAGNRTSLTAVVGVSSFATTYSYDALNRLATVTDSQGGLTSQSYDPNGNLESIAYANGVSTTHTFDTVNRLTDLTTANSIGTVLQSYAFTLANTGHRTRIDELDGTSRIYAYDDLYRLTEDRVEDASSALLYSQGMTYDAAGNRLILADDQGAGRVDTTYTYDTRDRLLTEDSVNYGWDQNGNLVSRSDTGGTGYAWDFENRLTGVTLADGTQLTHLYDPDGVRVRTEVAPAGGGTPIVTDYLNDTSGFLSHVVVESTAGAATVAYTRADDRLVSLYRPASGTSRYFHADGLGSVRLLTDGAGLVTDSYTYTAFGEEVDRVGSDLQPYQFAGEPLDPNSSFYYNRARWLDVGVGRFVAVDPFAGLPHDPVTLHRYLYGRNNPALWTDPSGQISLPGLTVIGVLLVAAAVIFSAQLSLLGPEPVFNDVPATDVSPRGIGFIASWEGLSLVLYNDVAGHCTIGYGHLVHLGPCNGTEPAQFLNGITNAEAIRLLSADAQVAVQAVRRNVRRLLSQHQFDAMVSFTFNLGETNLRRSQLLGFVNRGQRRLIRIGFNGWRRAGGRISPGLVNRRRAEANLFLDGDYTGNR